MYVCVCKGITDKDIMNAVDNGADTLRQVSKQLGVSTQCGQCACLTKELISERLQQQAMDSSLFYAA